MWGEISNVDEYNLQSEENQLVEQSTQKYYSSFKHAYKIFTSLNVYIVKDMWLCKSLNGARMRNLEIQE